MKSKSELEEVGMMGRATNWARASANKHMDPGGNHGLAGRSVAKPQEYTT